MNTIPHLGEILALATAMFWAVAVILFKKSGETVHPIALNLFKSLLATVLILPTVMLIEGGTIPDFSRRDVVLLLVSGALGIGIADTLFFMMLNRLGAALSSIVDCVYSPMVIAAAMIWLGERLGWLQLVGVVLIVSAVWEAMHVPQTPPNPPASRGESEGSAGARGNRRWIGVLWGISAMACMAVGIVMMKPILDTYSLLWVLEVRLVGGIAVLLLILAFNPKRREILGTLFVKQGWGYLLSGSFIGAYLALILWVAGIKYTQASQASALNQTSNIFVFILAGVFLKERMTKQRVIGIGLAVIGVYLVTFG